MIDIVDTFVAVDSLDSIVKHSLPTFHSSIEFRYEYDLAEAVAASVRIKNYFRLEF